MTAIADLPENVRKFIPCKSVAIRYDNGTYRVYKYGAVKTPRGKWASGGSYLIGKIIPDQGFCPNKRYQKELADAGKPHFTDEINDLAYGQYAFLITISSDIYERLKKYFPLERAAQIYCYGLILCSNGFVYLDQIDEFYRTSILSLEFKDCSFRMGYKALSSLLTDLGMKGNPVSMFEQSLIDDSSKNVAIDGHVIRSMSAENDLSEPGYKTRQLKAEQVNVIIAYDTKNSSPLMYRTYRGSSVDKKSAESFIRSRNFTDTKFVVDRGFFSGTIIHLMSENGNTYIIPVPFNNKNFKKARENLVYDGGEFVYHSGRKETARILFHEEQVDETTRIIVFKDVDENNSKRKNYQMQIALGEEGYTEEKYNEYCEWWGVYFLQTNSPETPAEIYADYKNRWSIETYNNYIKNDAGFNALKMQNYYVQKGFDFIMLVTGLIHSRLNEKVLSLNKASISTFDVLLKARHMRMVKEKNEWELHNTRKKDIELLQQMGFTPSLKYSNLLTERN